MESYDAHAQSATLVNFARETLRHALTDRARVHAVVRLIAELASLGLKWPEIETVVHEFGVEHGLDLSNVLASTHRTLINVLLRRMAGEPSKCWQTDPRRAS